MSHQVLARKWRPASFVELVGQEHVQQALINALDRDRLHHAYLFTGTRGVGKTTIARIFAKCLNCEQGVSSTPCGECSACQEIAEGRFIDLIEVDAASRTKVDDTRELLENVQYAPTRGRYKVYLIDEVHMLSNHSFNALLKTLEEPPPHVKFLLATTDPQKLPATVLSRCLQFNLKNMSAERIVSHLQHVLGEESVSAEEPALWLLAEAARGSMRDALSLADQAIAYGAGAVQEQEVATMLGTIDRQATATILGAVVANEGEKLFEEIERLASLGTDFQSLVDELMGFLHSIAVAQAVPEVVPPVRADIQRIGEFADKLSGEDVQIFYQMALNARRDLPYVPEPRRGFEMLALRLLAFRPVGSDELSSAAPEGAEGGEQRPKKSKKAITGLDTVTSAAPVKDTVPEREALVEQVRTPAPSPTPIAKVAAAPAVLTATISQQGAISFEELTPDHWLALFPQLDIDGVARSVVSNAVLSDVGDKQLQFILDQDQAGLYNEDHRQKLESALQAYFSRPLKVAVEEGQLAAESPARQRLRLKAERMQAAIAELKQDPNIELLQREFDGRLDIETVQPRD